MNANREEQKLHGPLDVIRSVRSVCFEVEGSPDHPPRTGADLIL
jgi:hypothetical protein